MGADVMMNTFISPWRKVRSVNETSNGYVSKIPVGTDPFITAGVTGDAGTATGASIIRIAQDPTTKGTTGQNLVELCFYAVGANNNTFSARVLGWSCLTSTPFASVTDNTNLWIPIVLCEVALTISSTPIGLANKAIVATELFADTITLTGTTANAGMNVNIVSPANDKIARMVLDLEANMAMEVQFTTGGSATSCNALYRFL